MSMKKQSYLSPVSGTLEIAFLRLGHPTVVITLDLGIPNFTVFSFKFSIPQGEPGDLQQLLGEAIVALLDEMTAFMLSTGYRKEVIAKVYALVLACYKDMAAGGKQKGDRDKDPAMASTRGSFKLPMEFIDETQRHVVTASSKKIERSPKVRAMEFLPARTIKPQTGDVLKAIRKYRFQNIKTQPFPMYIVVYDQMGNPKGTLSLGPNFHNELLKMQYKKEAGATGLPKDLVYHNTSSENLPSIKAEGLTAGSFSSRPIAAFGDVWLAVSLADLGPVQRHSYGKVTSFETDLDNSPVPEEKIYLSDKHGKIIGRLSGAEKIGSSLLLKKGSVPLTQQQREAVIAGGGMPVGGVEEGMVWFNSPATGSTLVVDVGELTPKAVRDAIRASDQRFKNVKKKADYVDERDNWAGEGGAASGILPICSKTGRVCLAWRSSDVDKGDCWGTIGGAVLEGMSPAESARHELKEETGYSGQMFLRNAFVYQDGKFRYFNFIGEVQQEFRFRPMQDSSWETNHLEWMGLDELESQMESNPGEFHPGVIALFENSGSLIRRICGKAGQGNPSDERKTQ